MDVYGFVIVTLPLRVRMHWPLMGGQRPLFQPPPLPLSLSLFLSLSLSLSLSLLACPYLSCSSPTPSPPPLSLSLSFLLSFSDLRSCLSIMKIELSTKSRGRRSKRPWVILAFVSCHPSCQHLLKAIITSIVTTSWKKVPLIYYKPRPRNYRVLQTEHTTRVRRPMVVCDV